MNETQAAYLTTATQLANTGLNVYGQSKLNKKTMKFSREMYALQREHALADWQAVNEYNSPRAQMQRYRDAGLNPHLIYGQSNESPAIRSSDVQGWNPRTPDIDLDARPVLGAYYDTKMKEASLDTVALQQELLRKDQGLKDAQIAATLEGVTNMQLKNNILSTYGVQAKEAEINKIYSDIGYTWSRNEREQLMNTSNLAEAAKRMLKMEAERLKTEADRLNTIANTAKTQQETLNAKMQERNIRKEFWRIDAQIDSIHLENTMKRIENRMAESNIFKGDPGWWRQLELLKQNLMSQPGKPRSYTPWQPGSNNRMENR